MNRITHWIKDHQVIAFFILTFAITWPGLILAYFIFPGNDVVEILTFPVVFSPALAAMLISGIAEPAPKSEKSRGRWIAFILTLLVAAAVQAFYFQKITDIDLTAPIILICVYVAIFPAWVLSSVFARTPGVRKQFSTILRPRGPTIWYLVIFLFFPGIPLLAMWITRLSGGEAQFHLAGLGIQGAATVLVLEFLRGFLMTGGINEESGWRGFALPRLQARYPVIVSAVIVWFFWALWHLPYDIGRGDQLAWILENRIFWNLMVSIIMTWLYNQTNGSILAPALFHPAMNTFGNSISVTTAGRVLILGLAFFVVVYARMWKRLPEESLALA